MSTKQDKVRLEAARYFGFEEGIGCGGYYCTEETLLDFAKGCERAGRTEASQIARQMEKFCETTTIEGVTPYDQGVAAGIACTIAEKIEELNIAEMGKLIQ